MTHAMTDPMPMPTPPDAPPGGTPLAYQAAPPRSPRRFDAWGTRIAWGVIVASVALIFGANFFYSRHERRAEHQAAQDPAKLDSVQLKLTGYNALAMHRMAAETKGPQPSLTNDDELVRSLRDAADSPVDKLRAVPLIAEIKGPAAALTELDRLALPALPPKAPPEASLGPDAASLRTIYTRGAGALGAHDKAELVRRHGWFGQLALTTGAPDTSPARQAVLAPVNRAWFISMAAGVGVLIAFAVGLVLFILAIVFLVQRRAQRAYKFDGLPPDGPYAPKASTPAPAWPGGPYTPPGWPAGYGPPPAPYGPAVDPPADPTYVTGGTYGTYGTPPAAYPFYPAYMAPMPSPARASLPPLAGPDPNARTGPFLEAFAVYLGGQILLSIVVAFLVRTDRLEAEWFMLLMLPLAFLWPILRGVSWKDWRRGLGWHRGRGVLREIAAGAVGYVGGLPLFALGLGISILLTKLAHTRADHPLQHQVAGGWWNHLQLYLLACVWAPIVEETMFRGALFHHLRRRWGWIFSASFVAVLFAAIHPQGWTLIPGLGMLAVMLAALREWRGSIVAPMTAHFLQNFMVTTYLILVLG